MNRRRQDYRKKISGAVTFSLILAGALGAVGGVTSVCFKNRQIQTAREIDAAEKRIESYELSIRTTDMRKDQLMNLFAMKKSLGDIGTAMRPIPQGVTEEIPPAQPATLASVEPAL